MNRHSVIFGLALTLLLTIIACGGGAASTSTVLSTPIFTSEPTVTQNPSSTVAPTSTLEPTATTEATAIPTLMATATPALLATTITDPTETRTPADTPVSEVPDIPSVTIEPSKDNTLYEDADGLFSNGAGQHFFVGRNNSGLARRSVIAFDIIGNIPANATIKSVNLTLRVSRTQAGEEDVKLHRLIADWGEGASAASANEGGTAAEAGDSTWIHTRFDSKSWQSPGGDFSAAARASKPVGGVGSYSWTSTDELVADIQGWLEDPLTNFGWILLGNETGNKTTKRFDSKENSTLANRPSLTVEFILP